jgi:hypothetical protein
VLVPRIETLRFVKRSSTAAFAPAELLSGRM